MWTLFLFALVAGTAADHQLRIHNRCGYEIWVGLLGRPWSPDRGGFKLSAHQRRTSVVPNKWSGRVWGRTHCHGNRCETGDCGRGVHCNGAGGEPPATLAEITFDAGGSHNQDFYDISLVDGYNLQMSMSPVRGSYRGNPTRRYCARAGCNTDLNKSCPRALRKYRTGGVIGCKSACLVFNTDRYCCRGAYRTAKTCPPFNYSRIFKKACPQAYSYAYDDETSTFTCNGHHTGQTNYEITFCG